MLPYSSSLVWLALVTKAQTYVKLNSAVGYRHHIGENNQYNSNFEILNKTQIIKNMIKSQKLMVIF